MKPRIKAAGMFWRCGIVGGCWCYDTTPRAAYFRWMQYGK
jgi:hypothetical protein